MERAPTRPGPELDPGPVSEHSRSYAIPPREHVPNLSSVARSVPISKVIYAVLALLFAAGVYILNNHNVRILEKIKTSSASSGKAIQGVGDKIDKAIETSEKVNSRVHDIEKWRVGMVEWRTALELWQAKIDKKLERQK